MKKISHIAQGEGPSIVLIHGFCEDKMIWKPLFPFLIKHFQVISVDIPGFGESDLLEEVNMEKAADVVKKILDSMEVQNCVMIGHSLGGYITLAFAKKYPEMLKGFTLFHSSAYADPAEKKEKRTKTIEFVKENGGKKFVDALFPNLFSAASKEKMPELIKELINKSSNTSETTITSYTAAMRDREDRTEVLKNSDCPIQMIIGKEDQAVPFKDSMEQLRMPKETHSLILDRVAHMGMFEATEKTGLALRSFAAYCLDVKLVKTEQKKSIWKWKYNLD